MTEYETHKTCPLSGSNRLIALRGYEKHYLVQSKPLGFVFCSRIPSNQELERHYSQYNRHLLVPETTLTRYRELLADLEKYKKTGKILDVGCGMGDFLEIAKEQGWDVYGTEFTDEAIEVCKSKGINMRQGPLNAAWFGDDEFDVITSFEVIEHINNPRDDMQIISKALRKGGVFYCTTPNFNALERRLLKSNYNIIEYPEHLCYYTRRTLNYLMNDFGFKPLWVRTTGLSISRIKQAFRKNVKREGNLNTDEQLRISMHSRKWVSLLVTIINVFLNLTKSGNALKGMYRKI